MSNNEEKIKTETDISQLLLEFFLSKNKAFKKMVFSNFSYIGKR